MKGRPSRREWLGYMTSEKKRDRVIKMEKITHPKGKMRGKEDSERERVEGRDKTT